MKIKASMFILVATACWGLSPLFYSILESKGVSAENIVFLRFLFVIPMTAIFILITDRSLFKIKLKDVWLFALMGAIGFAGASYCYIKSISIVNASVAAVLFNTSPIFVMIVSLFVFKEKLSIKKTVALILTIVGCCLVSGVFAVTAIGSGLGALFGIIAAICSATYSILCAIAIKKGYSYITVLFYVVIFTTLTILPLASPIKLFSSMTTNALLISLALAFCTFIAYAFFNLSLSIIPSSTATIIATSEIIFASLTGVLFLNDIITWSKALGILLIIFSIILLNIKFSKKINKTRL